MVKWGFCYIYGKFLYFNNISWMGTLEWFCNVLFIYFSGDQSYAKGLDSLVSSHPVQVEVHRPEEINEIFDSISYSKGSSVLRMLFCYLGEELFQKGIHEYLEKYKYSNARTEDLWKSLEEGSGKPVSEFMNKYNNIILLK